MDLTGVLRTVFIIVHVVSAGIWVSQFAAKAGIGRLAASIKAPAAGPWLRMAQGGASSFMGQIGGVGVLVSGLVLVGLNSKIFGILGIGPTPLWLFLMELIFLVAMGVVGVGITRPQRTIMPAIQQAMARNEPPPPEALAGLARIEMMSQIVNLLVLINIILGIWRPT